MYRRTLGLIGAAGAAVALSLIIAGPAVAQTPPPDVFQVNYFDVATSAAPSRSGYGGIGVSGGAGDNTVRIVNPTQVNNRLCAMIYVFDDFEEMQTCCGCPISPDEMKTTSVFDDLTFDFGVNKANLNAGIIEIVSSTTNFNPGNPPLQIPPGALPGCDPTGSFSTLFPQHNGVGTSEINPTPALRAWITHDELVEPGNIVGGKVNQGASVNQFETAPLDTPHLTNLEARCAFLVHNSSGSGVCTCGEGITAVPVGAARQDY